MFSWRFSFLANQKKFQIDSEKKSRFLKSIRFETFLCHGRALRSFTNHETSSRFEIDSILETLRARPSVRTKANNTSEDEIGRRTRSRWPK